MRQQIKPSSKAFSKWNNPMHRYRFNCDTDSVTLVHRWLIQITSKCRYVMYNRGNHQVCFNLSKYAFINNVLSVTLPCLHAWYLISRFNTLSIVHNYVNFIAIGWWVEARLLRHIFWILVSSSVCCVFVNCL